MSGTSVLSLVILVFLLWRDSEKRKQAHREAELYRQRMMR